MNDPHSNSDQRWEKLLRDAQNDAAPSVNVPALLRAVRQEPLPVSTGWSVEFCALFTIGRVVPTCLAGAVACTLLTVWQLTDLWQTLPWAQMLVTSSGGTP